jgi:hypothetical protein
MTAGTYDNIRDAIVVILEGLTGIGKVYGRQRFIVAWDQYLEAFKDTDRAIRGWYVTPAQEGTIRAGFSTFGNTERVYSFIIAGVLGLADSSDTESAFMAMAETVIDAFLGRTKLGTVTGQVEVTAAALLNYSYRQFGSVFCHYGEVGISVSVEVAG